MPRKLKISVANSRTATKWANRETTWEEFTKRLSTTYQTAESLAEFLAMPKDEQTDIKDVGGFVLGQLKDGSRKAGYVECRSAVALDMDYGTPGIMTFVRERLPYKGCAYGTHKYSPDKPRLRLIFPLSRDITEEEYEPMARALAVKIGMDYFDDSTFQATRMMFWPSTPADVHYYFESWDGPVANPDDLLGGYADWRDISSWPVSSRETTKVKQNVKRQADPLTKDGVVGAFCRSFSIQEAIERFLGDTYVEAHIPGRYTYKPGEGTAGVVVYDDKFAYSHHATDPARAKLLNAFDLVRVHLFPDEDASMSFRAMTDFALTLPEVKRALTKDRQVEAAEDFDEGNWQNRLKYDRRGRLENCVWNLLLILRHDPFYANFSYNEMAHMVEVTGWVPWDRPEGERFWLDTDTDGLKASLDVHYLAFSTRNHDVAFSTVAMERRFHPIRDYLDSLPPWDGVERVPTLLVRYLDADDTKYVRTVTRKTFAAAVARVYQPGIKFDCILVLDGAQGIGKSTLFKELVGEEYFSDSLQLSDMDGKAAAEKLQGHWVCEIAELAGLKKADQEKIKGFLSSSADKYRPAYGRVVESHPRHGILIATVNGEGGYLRDITGGRRFWVVKLHQTKQVKRFDFDEATRAQIWAEAKHLYQEGEELFLKGDLVEEATAAQRGALEEDERQGQVEEYLETLLPANWPEMDVYRRREYLRGDDPIARKGTIHRETVSNAEIWCECFGKPLSDLKRADSYAISALMMKVDGWERSTGKRHLPIYGQQRVYVRTT